MMKWLEWRIKRLIISLDISMLAFVVIVAATLALWLGQIRPLETQVAEARLAAEKPRPARVATPPREAGTALVQDLAAFEQFFPPYSQLTVQLEQLFDIIEKNGLMIDKGRYTLIERPESRMRRFEATFPVAGGYLPIRRVLDEVQRKLPNVAIADVSVQREKVGDARLVTELHFVLFLKRQS